MALAAAVARAGVDTDWLAALTAVDAVVTVTGFTGSADCLVDVLMGVAAVTVTGFTTEGLISSGGLPRKVVDVIFLRLDATGGGGVSFFFFAASCCSISSLVEPSLTLALGVLLGRLEAMLKVLEDDRLLNSMVIDCDALWNAVLKYYGRLENGYGI